MNLSLSADLVNKEKRLTCPYNPSHLVDPLRMAIHLIKCKKMYPHMRMKVCPFNATHHVREENITAHLEECKDKSIVEKTLFYRQHPSSHQKQSLLTESNCPNSGSSVAPSGFPPVCSSSEREDWDFEIENSVSYDPEKSVIYKEVSRLPPPGLGKSARKRWRQVEELRIRRLKAGIDIHDLVYPTVQGKEISIAEIVGDDEETVKGAEGLAGKGIFMPKPNPVMRDDQPIRRPHIHSRIAADIFNGQMDRPTTHISRQEIPNLDLSKGAGKKACRRRGIEDFEEALEIMSRNSSQ